MAPFPHPLMLRPNLLFLLNIPYNHGFVFCFFIQGPFIQSWLLSSPHTPVVNVALKIARPERNVLVWVWSNQ